MGGAVAVVDAAGVVYGRQTVGEVEHHECVGVHPAWVYVCVQDQTTAGKWRRRDCAMTEGVGAVGSCGVSTT